MERDFDEYAKRLTEAIHAADVVSVFFFQVETSFILDFRLDAQSAPLALLEPMMETPYQRLASFGRIRPTLELPENLTLAPWPGRVGMFESSGVLQAVLTRCHETGHLGLAAEASRCFWQLLAIERQQTKELIRGVGMESIWERGSSP
ncbi:hypothetical protein BH23CHL5_BH23CHL5_20970 [soil metagenome]